MINLVSCQELLMILLVLTVEGVALLAESLLQRRGRSQIQKCCGRLEKQKLR